MPEKTLFGDLSRQLRKVLDWRSLLVFSVKVVMLISFHRKWSLPCKGRFVSTVAVRFQEK